MTVGRGRPSEAEHSQPILEFVNAAVCSLPTRRWPFLGKHGSRRDKHGSEQLGGVRRGGKERRGAGRAGQGNLQVALGALGEREGCAAV